MDDQHNFNQLDAQLMAATPTARPIFQKQLRQQLKKTHAADQRRYTQLVPHRSIRWRMVAILAAVLLCGVGGVIALRPLIEQMIGMDGGLMAMLLRQGGHDLNISTSHNGYTLTLEWASVDSNRLALAIRFSGMNQCQAEYSYNCNVGLAVTDHTGASIPMIMGRTDTNNPDEHLMMFSFDMVNAVPDGAMWKLQLRAVAIETIVTGPAPDNPDVMQTSQKQLTDPLTLSFELPASTEIRRWEGNLPATDQDITLSLRRVSVTPSQLRVLVCFIPPDPARSWTAIPELATEQGAVSGGGAVNPTWINGESCQDYSYNAGMYDYSGPWQLEVVELIGFGRSARDEDQLRISGSWRFEFIVP